MLPEQQQLDLGYFIDEAKHHLNTIEQGLLNLQNTLNDPEMVNEVFRAARSVKGGAAMLELHSIQQTAHCLEDCFKVFQECSTIQVDQKLESLFLRVFDTLQELLEQLEGLFGLTEDVANNLMSEVEPVFKALNQHLELLVNQAGFGGKAEELEEEHFDDLNDLFASNLDENDSLEPDFSNLFETTEETKESLDLLEALTSDSSTEENWFATSQDIFCDLEEPPAAPLATVATKLDFPEVAKTLEFEATNDSDAAFLEDLFDADMSQDSASDAQPMSTGVMFLGGTQIMPVEAPSPTADTDELDDFADLEALLGEEAPSPTADTDELDDFADLEALLGEEAPGAATSANASQEEAANNEFFELDDLEKLLEGADKTTGVSNTVKPNQEQAAPQHRRRPAFEQTMRVPVKHLDNVSNLVGELVVNRNSLEQDQQRLRQFLDNLLHRVQQLSNLGSKMQDLYEQSLLEASLLANSSGSRSALDSNQATSSDHHATGMDFDALEMDRFTGFHTLSQEMIEMIVRVRESTSDIEFVVDETEQVARQFQQVTTQLQEGLTRSRMIPFAQIAERLPRAVRDITLKYGKQAELHIEGEDTLIDKVILEQLYDPMTHLVNNAITHGIETPEERSAKGKSPGGQITIRAFYQGNQTIISVGDDGAGIDPDRVMTKAIQKGLITMAQARTMSRLDVYNLLFHPGFSTKDQVDDFAGRGVGMDVVRTSLNEIRGTINTDSTLGKGTTFTIRLPLTLSICKALCCLSDKARIAFPMDGVEEMMDISAKNVQVNAEGQSCISWRDSLLPFRPLKELLTYNSKLSRGNVYGGNREDDLISIVVLRSGGNFIALQVDQVLGEQEIVIKQFEAPTPKPIGVAGATVMGDGRIMPIADVLELIDLFHGGLQREDGGKLSATSATPVLPETPASLKTEPTVLIVDDSITVRELLSMTFNKAGYRVQQARDGQEAWDKLRDGLPCDIVFCDIEMPRMDGLQLLSRMQQDPILSQLPIAMLTSRGADRHRQMAIQLGASGYFTKPYLEEALLDGAQRMLKGEVLVTTNT